MKQSDNLSYCCKQSQKFCMVYQASGFAEMTSISSRLLPKPYRPITFGLHDNQLVLSQYCPNNRGFWIRLESESGGTLHALACHEVQIVTGVIS
jgi:hypothetical protein